MSVQRYGGGEVVGVAEGSGAVMFVTCDPGGLRFCIKNKGVLSNADAGAHIFICSSDAEALIAEMRRMLADVPRDELLAFARRAARAAIIHTLGLRRVVVTKESGNETIVLRLETSMLGLSLLGAEKRIHAALRDDPLGKRLAIIRADRSDRFPADEVVLDLDEAGLAALGNEEAE